MNQNPWSVKRKQSANGPRWPGHYFRRVWKAFTSTRNQTYASDTSRNPLQSCLMFHSILDLLQKTSFWANFNSSYDNILSYLVKNSGCKETWTEGVRAQIIVINIWKIDGKGYICFENQTSFDNDLCRLRVISHLQFRGIRRCHWLSLDKSNGEFSIVYKKISALLWLRVYNHDFGL